MPGAIGRVAVAGGGIGGLTFAAAARRCGIDVTVIEKSPSLRPNIGGGIGLWPNSLQVLGALGARSQLEEIGAWMPPPSYRDARGACLGGPWPDFGTRFPVLCLHRDGLQQILHSLCAEGSGPPVRFMMDETVTGYRLRPGGDAVQLTLSGGGTQEYDILIGADGIHSAIRRQLSEDLGVPPPHPAPCGYAYFRACINGPGVPGTLRVDWHSASFESWGLPGLRFGYVPLKAPEVFWFAAVPTGTPDGASIEPRLGSHPASDRDKAMLLERFGDWRLPDALGTGQQAAKLEMLIGSTPSDKILRTDVYKVDARSEFPWAGADGRVVLLGDSAHATAPNLAQGAGLAIEDAATLAQLMMRHNDAGRRSDRPSISWRACVERYEAERRPRALTVQSLADVVATTGQLTNPALATARDVGMATAAAIAPGLTAAVFERMVSYSLGGDCRRLRWGSPLSGGWADAATSSEQCLLGLAMGSQFGTLPRHVRDFRMAREAGGSGTVTVERPGGVLKKVIGALMGLPPAMAKAPFMAEVQTFALGMQKWTRVFGAGTPEEVTYSTTHDARPWHWERPGKGSLDRSCHALTEGVGGALDRLVRFLYNVETAGPKEIRYESCGMALAGVRVPMPEAMLPSSRWKEVATDDGWTFDGTIGLPVIGTIMRYHGIFRISEPPTLSPKDAPPAPVLYTGGKPGCGYRAVVAGGSGMLGRVLCNVLVEEGWDVMVLSRSPHRHNAGVSEHRWDGRSAGDWWSHLTPNSVLINLAGENPGTARWSDGVKGRILSSRVEAIRACAAGMSLAHQGGHAPAAFLQASASGYYGECGGLWLGDGAGPGRDPSSMTGGERFRAAVCAELERRADDAAPGDTTVVSLRLGHILDRSGGLFPHLVRASAWGAWRLGPGNQFVPWVHVKDAARMIAAVASVAAGAATPPSGQPLPPAVNIASPNPITNEDLLHAISVVRGGMPGLVPLPAWLLSSLVGPSASVLLDSQRMRPEWLLRNNVEWSYPHIDDALANLNSNGAKTPG